MAELIAANRGGETTTLWAAVDPTIRRLGDGGTGPTFNRIWTDALA
ncbi:MAG: hypothetical protein IPN51_17570 [Chloracidobacterium sp.]|nr:hypothetical protein [Chloracidobacterium sp.]